MTADKSKPFVFYSEPLTLSEVKSNDITKHIISGYITTHDRDLVGDIVTNPCMESMMNQLKSRAIKLDIEHESWKGDNDVSREKAKTINPIGKINKAYKDGTGIFIEGELNPFHKRFDEVKGSVNGGFLDAFSIAYVPTATKRANIDGKDTRLLDQLSLLNVALTGNPINTQARMAPIMAKSLEFMNSFSSNDDIKLEENMAEEENNKPEATIEPEAKAAMPEVKAEDKDKIIADLKAKIAELEAKDKPKEPESKALNRIDILEKELTEIKALLTKPQYKASAATVDGIAKNSAQESGNPLDFCG